MVRASVSEWKLPAMKWPSRIKAVLKVINHSTLHRLGSNSAGNVRCSMEVFTELTPSLLILRPMLKRTYRTLYTKNQERLRSIVDVGRLHESLEVIHKEVLSRSKQAQKRA